MHGALLPVTLAKAKTKRVLRVDAMITDGPYGPIVAPIALAASVSANGLPMQPSPPGGFAVEDCGAARGDPDATFTLTATWWLDIDDPANVAILTPDPTRKDLPRTGGNPTSSGEAGAPS